MLDLFLYYADNICDEKIKDLRIQVKFYGFIACIITIAFIFFCLLLFSVWIFSLNEDSIFEVGDNDKLKNRRRSFENIYTDDESENIDDSSFWDLGLKNSFTEDFREMKQDFEIDHVIQLKNLYIPKWDISREVIEKALFWKNNQLSKKNECPGYDNIIDIYASGILEVEDVNAISETNNHSDNEDDEVYENVNHNLKRINFKRVLNYSTSDLLSGGSGFYESYENPISKIYSHSSIQKTPVSKAYSINETDDYESEVSTSDIDLNLYSNCHSKISRISLLLEDDSEVSNKIASNGSNKNELLVRSSKSEDNIIVKNKKKIDAKYNSREQTIKMGKIGPTYLYVYLNLIYGSWDEFKSRGLLSDRNFNNKIGTKNLFKFLKYFNRNQVRDFKWTKIIDKLKTIRGAFFNEKYHDVILECIIKNIEFLASLLINEKIENKVKLEIYYLFFYSFSFESKIQLSFEFVNLIIKSMIKSLSLIKYEKDEESEESEEHENMEENLIIFNDGLRCLYSVLGYSNIDDFIIEIYKKNFGNINELTFKEQSIVWELFKLIICEWMLEAENIGEIRDIYHKLNANFENSITNYVEKDNPKFQEFLIIWKMLINMVNARDEHNNDENENINKVEMKCKDNNNKLKRRLSMENLKDVSNTI